jgi:phage shock protein E
MRPIIARRLNKAFWICFRAYFNWICHDNYEAKIMPLKITAAFLTVLMMYLVACGQAPTPVEQSNSEITATELSERIAAGSAPLILDVRSRKEYDAGHLPGALLVPHDEFLDQPAATLAMLPSDKNTEIALHCHSGKRAGMVDEVLQQAGYTNVRLLEGDWVGWQAGNYPVEN